MNEKWKGRWIEALESGRYQQGENFLRSGDRHCCLGVLADLMQPESWVAVTQDGLTHYEIEENAAYLPDHLREEVDLEFSQAIRLADMNDKGSTFGEIAAVIREEY